MTEERYSLELRGLPNWRAPVSQRLGLFLKAARRQFGLECLSVVEVQPAGQAQAGEPGNPGNEAENERV